MEHSTAASPSAVIGKAPTPQLQNLPDETGKTAVLVRRGILGVAAGRIRSLHVLQQKDSVILEGRCSTFYCKQIAQTVALDLARGYQVSNRIEVDE